MLFVKIKCDSIDYSWMIKLQTLADVMEYGLYLDPTLMTAYKDFKRMTTETLAGYKTHVADHVAHAALMIAECQGISPVAALASINSEKLSCMIDTLPVCVNRNGGWFPCTDACEQYDAIEAKKWPGDYKPEFKQWPGGKHWYCKVGGRDMIIDGKQKWNTLDAAKRAHERWAGPKQEEPK